MKFANNLQTPDWAIHEENNYFCLMKKRKYILISIVASLILTSCNEKEKHTSYDLSGAWIMTHIVDITGGVHDYSRSGTTLCRIYEGDSIFYECEISTLKPDRPQDIMTASDVSIVPIEKTDYTLKYIGGSNTLYLENGKKRPITFAGDTAMSIQRHGEKYMWIPARKMNPTRIEEIKNIITTNLRDNQGTDRFVLPTTERQLEAANHTLTHLIIILVLSVLFIVYSATNIYRKKKRIEQQLRQINEEREQRPQPVRQAMAEVEEQFLSSDFYLSLRRRITAGEHLKPQDWKEVEQQIRPVWPGFTNRLLGLCHMSELEYRVCLLIKLRVSPSEMAVTLSKDTSSISSIRSRLCQKVFQRKGSSKEWDSFVLSL